MIFNEEVAAIRNFKDGINLNINNTVKNNAEHLIKLNQKNLEFQGIGSDGKKLKMIGSDYDGYAEMTKEFKRPLGLETRWVTLKHTEAFYNSFKVVITGTGFYITATDIVTEAVTMNYGEHIFGIEQGDLEVFLHRRIVPELRKEAIRVLKF